MILDYNLILPPWLCQPLIRVLPPQRNLDGIESNREVNKSNNDKKEVDVYCQINMNKFEFNNIFNCFNRV